MSGYNAMVRREARRAACKGAYDPQKFTVTIYDSHDRMRYRLATTALWGQSVGLPSFFILCAEYVIRHHRGLKEVRRQIRLHEAAMRKEKRRLAMEARRARREALKRWKGPGRG